MKSRILFKEEQTFIGTWSWYMTLFASLGVFILFMWASYQQIVLHIPWGNKPLSNLNLIIVSITICLLLAAIFYFLHIHKLSVEIDEEGIRYKYVPYHRKFREIKTKEILEVKISTYQPLLEFGGWGYRLSYNKKAFSVKGKWALIIRIKSRNKIYFGTQQPDKMKEGISKWKLT